MIRKTASGKAVLVAILMAATGEAAMAQEEAVSNAALRREVGRLHEELVELRRKLERESGVLSLDRPELSGARDAGRATEDDLLAEMNRLRRDAADLALALSGSRRKSLPAPEQTSTGSVTASGQTYTIRAGDGLRPRELEIRNTGEEVLTNPRLVVNGRRNWHDVDSLLAEALGDSKTDRDKAVAIWKFLVDNRTHGYPAHRHIEVHDPVRFLNVYGYGFCDDAATNFMVLAEKAGLPSRVWGLSGHVVPEAFYDGAWHVFDPDGEIYYLDDDGTTISSIATLERREDIIRKCPSPFYTDAQKLVDIYTTTEDNKVSPWYKETSEGAHRMDYTLRPGESILWSWDNWGFYFTSHFLNEPARYGNGRFTFEPVFKAGLYLKGAAWAEGVEHDTSGAGGGLTTRARDSEGVLVYRFHSPYPLLAGNVRIEGFSPSGGGIDVAFADGEGPWQEVWSSGGAGGPIARDVATSGYFRNGYARPAYDYGLRLRLRSTAGERARIERLVVTSDFQHAPHALPTLEAGENVVRYTDGSAGGRSAEVVFRFDAGRSE